MSTPAATVNDGTIRRGFDKPAANWLAERDRTTLLTLFWADGGYGKSTLLRQIRQDHFHGRSDRLAATFDLSQFDSIELFLWQLRQQLQPRSVWVETATWSFAFERFDYCADLLRLKGASSLPTREQSQSRVAKSISSGADKVENAPFISDVAEFVGERISHFASDAKPVKTIVRPLMNEVRKRTTLNKFPELLQLGGKELEELRELLISYFWSDLDLICAAKPELRIAFLLDNHHSLVEANTRWRNATRMDAVERVFRRAHGVLILLASRQKPLWWQQWADQLRSREDGFQGRLVLHALTDFAREEVDMLLATCRDLTDEVKNAIAAEAGCPYLVAQRIDVARAAQLKGELVDISHVRGSTDIVHERLLDCWTEDEQVCLAVLGSLGSFSAADFRAVLPALHLRVGPETFERFIASASVAEEGGAAGFWRVHAYFGAALAARQAQIEQGRTWLVPETSWLRFERLSARVSDDVYDMAQCRALVRTVGCLVPTALNERRWLNFEDVLRRLAACLQLGARNRDAGTFLESSKLGRMLSPSFWTQVDDRRLMQRALPWLVQIADHCSSAARRHKDIIDDESLEWCIAFTEGWRRYLKALLSRPQLDRSLSDASMQLWMNKLGLNVAGLTAGTGRGAAERQLVAEILKFAEDAGAVSENELPLANFAAERLAARARGDRGLDADASARLHGEAKRLHALIIAGRRDPATLLLQCVTILNPPGAAIIPLPELLSVHRTLRGIEEVLGATDQILHLKARALIRIARHARDAGELNEVAARLDEADTFLRAELAEREGVARFQPARVILRVLRKRRELLGRLFDLDADGPILETAASCAILLGHGEGRSLYYEVGATSEASAIADQSPRHLALVARTFLREAANHPKSVSASPMLDWVRDAAIGELVKEGSDADRHRRADLIGREILCLDRDGRSLFWQSEKPPLQIWELLARLRLEHSWRLFAQGRAEADEVIERYAQWIRSVRGGDRSSCRRILVDMLARTPRLSTGSAEVQVQFWRLMRDVSFVHLPDDLSIHAGILQFGSEHLRYVLPEQELANARSSIDFLRKRLSGDVTIASLLTVAKRRSRSPDRAHQQEGRRFMLEALALADGRLPEADPLRREVRLAFAVALWNQLWLQHHREEPKALPPRVPPAGLEAFAAGPHEALATDLLALLATVPLTRLDPGTMCIGTVVGIEQEGDREAFTLEVSGMRVTIPLSLVSISLFQAASTKPGFETAGAMDGRASSRIRLSAESVIGRHVFLNLLRPREGVPTGTTRGAEYVASLLGLLYPGCGSPRWELGQPIPQLWLGASNSWAVVRTPPNDVSVLLSGGGWLEGLVRSLTGLRRLTIVPGYAVSGEHRFYAELRHFVNNSWSDLTIEDVLSDRVLLTGPTQRLQDERKRRSFESMFVKVFPAHMPVIASKPRLSLG